MLPKLAMLLSSFQASAWMLIHRARQRCRVQADEQASINIMYKRSVQVELQP